MHYAAGVLLIAQFALMWLVEKTVTVEALDYAAMVIWCVAIALIFLPMLTLRQKGEVPSGQSFVSTRELVDTGIYALVRHPLYLGWMLMYVVVWMFNPNWVTAGTGIVGMACVYGFTRHEEQLLLAKFGEPYESYMQKVPRLNLLAGVVRRLEKGKRKP